jgi:hypothetical protein
MLPDRHGGAEGVDFFTVEVLLRDIDAAAGDKSQKP